MAAAHASAAVLEKTGSKTIRIEPGQWPWNERMAVLMNSMYAPIRAKYFASASTYTTLFRVPAQLKQGTRWNDAWLREYVQPNVLQDLTTDYIASSTLADAFQRLVLGQRLHNENDNDVGFSERSFLAIIRDELARKEWRTCVPDVLDSPIYASAIQRFFVQQLQTRFWDLVTPATKDTPEQKKPVFDKADMREYPMQPMQATVTATPSPVVPDVVTIAALSATTTKE